ncbi:MAG: hypothetical protein RI926_1279 [Actinomycetota bacterium]|jgi:methionine-rich copper-binding protein CopC
MIRKVTAAIAALFMSLFVVAGTASMASAHSDTFQSVPASGSTVSTPVIELQFTFVEPVNAELSPPEVALVDAEGVPAQLGAPALDETGATMTVPIATGALPNGTYTASYRIVSEDGHPASGSVSFTVEGSDADPLAEAVPVEEEAVVTEADAELMVTSSGAESDNSQLQLVLGLSAAGAVALAAVLVIVALRRRRNSTGK